MRAQLTQLAEDILFLALSVFLAYNLFFLVVGEAILICEPNPFIRVSEFIFSLAVLGFAIYLLVSHNRERRRQ